jgi:transcriptional regulator with XRE-family HTH domain
MATLNATIANNIRAERARRKWSQTELGERIGIPRSSVGDLESGRHKATIEDLVLLCRAFGIGLSKLMDGADSEDIAVLTQ